MVSAIFSLVLMSASTSSVAAWEKVFEMPRPDAWISSVWATGPKDWFVAGKWGVTRVSDGRVAETRETPGHMVHGLYAEGPANVFAVGNGELVLHFDGSRWTEEHIGPKSARPIDRGETLLQAAFRPDARSSIIAFGPQLVLVRQSDATWTKPQEPEGSRLAQLAQGGPTGVRRPSRCDRGLWLWGTKSSAWFECQDGRGFVYDAGKVTAWGKRPLACKTVTTVGVGKDVAYASCANGTLWQTDAKTWRAIEPPPDKSKELGAISVVKDCVFVASARALWRSCKR
jgi:hypothetical protein